MPQARLIPTINHSPWLLLNQFPNVRTRTKEDWIKYVYVAIEQVCGYASIPLSIWEDMHLTEKEVIGTNKWVFQKASLSMCFRKLVAAPEIEFGGPKPKKPKKVIAKYVWNSLI